MRKLLPLVLLVAAGCGSEGSSTENTSTDAGPNDAAEHIEVGSAADAQSPLPATDALPEVSTSIDGADGRAIEAAGSPDSSPTLDAPLTTDGSSPPDVASESDAASSDSPGSDANPIPSDAGPDAIASIDASTPDAAQDAACAADQFIGCDDASTARFCNAGGVGTRTQNCGSAGCNAAAGRCNLCAPGSTSCGLNVVKHCGQDGMPSAVEDPCPLSCISSPVAHCAFLQPTYFPDLCVSPATAPTLDIAADTTIDAGNDVPCNGGTVAQSAGPSLCILRYGSITVESMKLLKVIGSRGVLLVADTSIDISGLLDVSADGITSGPGGGTIISGGAATQNTGGGGAGFLVAGASGGSATTDGGGALGGASVNPIGMQSLIGGPKPGVSATLIRGGGGGGAVMLIACRGSVAVSGTIDAGGGGGSGGVGQVVDGGLNLSAGGGGGAGGYVVIQGLAVNLNGQFFSNGGGGGAGAPTDTIGAPGSDGQRSTAAALGGTPVLGAGVGGTGGSVVSAPGVGGHGASGTASAGGGGGSPGRLQVYVPLGVTPGLTPFAASPAFQPTLGVATR